MALFNSILKPDTSVMLGLANGAIVMAVYNGAIPSIASVRVADSQDGDIEAARKMAAWSSAAILGFMFLLTKDRNSFLIGGLVLAGTDLMVKHANGWNPFTGLLDGKEDDGDLMAEGGEAPVYPLPNYNEESDVMEG